MKLKIAVNKNCVNKTNAHKVAQGWLNINEDLAWLQGWVTAGYGWCATHFVDRYRLADNSRGSNVVVIDIDGDTFKRFLAIIMISVGLIIVFRSKSIASLDLPERLSGKYLIGGLIGFFFIGVYGGFLQAGVGIVIMLLLTQINRMNLLRTNSVKAFSVFIYSIAAVLIFALDGKILWMVGFWMVLGSVVGAWLSSRWSVKKGDKVIRITLLIMVSYMAVKLWLDTFNT